MPELHGPLPLQQELPTEIASPFRREDVAGDWCNLHGESDWDDATSHALTMIAGNLLDLPHGSNDRREWQLRHSQFKLHIPERQISFRCRSPFGADLPDRRAGAQARHGVSARRRKLAGDRPFGWPDDSVAFSGSHGVVGRGSLEEGRWKI